MPGRDAVALGVLAAVLLWPAVGADFGHGPAQTWAVPDAETAEALDASLECHRGPPPRPLDECAVGFSPTYACRIGLAAPEPESGAHHVVRAGAVVRLGAAFASRHGSGVDAQEAMLPNNVSVVAGANRTDGPLARGGLAWEAAVVFHEPGTYQLEGRVRWLGSWKSCHHVDVLVEGEEAAGGR